MTRPAIIIGLGGTGQWVLTYLKKYLIENGANHGELPENVRLLAFDTMPEAQAGASTAVQDSGDVARDKEIAMGSIHLDPDNEFFGLMGNGALLGQKVINGEAPYIGNWFDARFYRSLAGQALWDLAAGSAQVRQFGRLAFFMKVDSIIWTEIQKAFTKVKKHAAKGNEVEVIIVASFAGGTGAGMFIDTGIVCRSLAHLVQNNLNIRGFFVLPRAFVQSGDLNMKPRHTLARSFAAWRELDRFMNISQEFGSPAVVYNPREPNLRIQLDYRPFDQCYLVDSRREEYSLETTIPEEGVFPSIANFLSALLDWKAGTIYSLDSRNREGEIQVQRRAVGYTAFGTWSVRSPIHYTVQEYSFNFAKDLINLWLRPERDENNNLKGLANNRNREAGDGTKRGRDESIDFLKLPTGVPKRIAAGGQTVKPDTGAVEQLVANTIFLQRVADIYTGHKMDDGTAIQNDAMGGHTVLMEGQIDPNTYIGTYGTLPTDAETTKILYDNREQQVDLSGLNNELIASVWTAIPPSREMNEHPSDFPSRFDDDIKKFERNHFGVGTSRGDYGAALDKARLFQVARFGQLLHQWTLNTLNGTSSQSINRLSGKLGYAYDFYAELVKTFDYFVKYIDAVIEKRGQLQLRNNAVQVRDTCREAMLAAMNKKCMFFFTHPRAHITQRQFLAAVDELHTITKDDMLLATLSQTGDELRKVALNAQQAAKNWIDTLVMGRSNSIGAYKTVLNNIDNVNAVRSADQNAGATQLLLNMLTYKQLPDDVKQRQLEEALNRFWWEVDTQVGFNILCSALVPERRIDEEGNTSYRDVPSKFSLEDTSLENNKNVEIFAKIGNFVFREEPDKHRVIEEVMKLTQPNYADPTLFAKDLLSHSRPLLELNEGSVTYTSLIRSMYLRLNARYDGVKESVTDYVTKLDGWIKEHHGLPEGGNYRLVPSEDEHELTFIQLFDNLQDTDFTIWDELRKVYQEHILSGVGNENAARLHIFPAECNAASYETKLASLLSHHNKGYRVFHPRVVMLLEDANHTSLFFRCWAYGWIKEHYDDKSSERFYYLDVPRIGENIAQKVILTRSRDQNGLIRSEAPSVFEVMNAFVNTAKDVHNPQRQIVWNHLDNAARYQEAEYRRNGELDQKLKKEIDSGLVNILRKRSIEVFEHILTTNPQLSQTKGTWDWKPGQDYDDLADLAEMMYLEVLRNQTPELSRRSEDKSITS